MTLDSGTSTIRQGEPYYFVSYARGDAKTKVDRLRADLHGRFPPVGLFVDRHDLGPGNFEHQLSHAIRACRAFLFVLTPGSVRRNSACRTELSEARRFKKDIIPLRFSANAWLDMSADLQEIDFSKRVSSGTRTLIRYLEMLESPPWKIDRLRGLIEDQQLLIKQTRSPLKRAKHEASLSRLCSEHDTLCALLGDPAVSAAHARARAGEAVSLVREGNAASTQERRSRLVNPLPMVPASFQDRERATKQLETFLAHPGQRLAVVFGRSGIGKTALVCKVLHTVSREKPRAGERHRVDAVVSIVADSALDQATSIRERLLSALTSLLDVESREMLSEVNGVAGQTFRLVQLLGKKAVVVLLDGVAARPVAAGRFAIEDVTLLEILQIFLKAPENHLKFIITCTAPLSDLGRVEPARQMHLPVSDGLPAAFAQAYLLSLDEGGDLGIAASPPAALRQLVERTAGSPKLLEGTVAFLRSNRRFSLDQIVYDDEIMNALGAELFASLGQDELRVMQILSVFPRPVPEGAVDFVVSQVHGVVDVEGALARLSNLMLVRRNSQGRVFLHSSDRDYARSLLQSPSLPEGDRRIAELSRVAAAFYRAARPEVQKMNDYSQVDPLIAEFELHVAAGNVSSAIEVLEAISEKLTLWGYARGLVDRYQSLLDLTTSREQEVRVRFGCANALRSIGRYEEAIGQYAACLASAPQPVDAAWRAAVLSYLARCHYACGRCDSALTLCDEASGLMAGMPHGGERKRRLRYLEGVKGVSQLFTGDIDSAIDSLSRAVAVGQPDDPLEADRHVGYLGLCYAYMGESKIAMNHFRRALSMAQAAGHRYGEGMHSCNLAEALISAGEVEEGFKFGSQARTIGDGICSPRVSGWSRWCLALCLARRGRLAEARDLLLDAAEDFPDAMNDDSLHMLLGVLCLRLGHQAEAEANFERAISSGRAVLASNPRYFFALDSCGIASAGLALLGDTAARERAVTMFLRARAVIRAKGYVGQVSYLMELLAPACKLRWFARIRAAARQRLKPVGMQL